MVSWTDAAQRISSANPRDLSLAKRTFGRIQRTPIVITGNSGAGKTRLWSRLTLRERLERMSAHTDDGYMVAPNKKSLALVTIPGQQLRPRFTALEQYFGESKRLHGVIFVAAYGYDHIWPV